ncbi:MAG: GNAT family N-acetyltransferase, partial [Cyanobacteria bacterium P01_H01_bin.130]
MIDCAIRRLQTQDEPFLWEMLYQALYLPEGAAPLPRQVLRSPELARYVENWGRQGDVGFLASMAEGIPIGAVWLRLPTG